MEAGIVPDVMGSFDPMVSFYAGYKASDGDKALLMPGTKLKMKETKFPFEFSVENIMKARNVTRNSRFVLYMVRVSRPGLGSLTSTNTADQIGPDSPTRESPTERNMRHYLAGNFTLEQTKSEVLASAMIMKNSTPAFNDYMAPEPKAGSGMHRYVYLLYVQPEKLNKMGFDAMGVDKMNRKNFNVGFIQQSQGSLTLS